MLGYDGCTPHIGTLWRAIDLAFRLRYTVLGRRAGHHDATTADQHGKWLVVIHTH